jgi:spore coat protein CotH
MTKRIKTSLIYGFCFLLILLFNGCPDAEEEKIEEEFIVPIIKPNGSEKYINLSSDFIFDQNELRTFELKLPKKDLEKIDSDPTAEQYVEGMLIFEGDTISPVGIRYKGSVGAWVGCVDGPNLFEPSGKKICTKLSTKIKINWKGRNERFYDLKKLQFHAQNLDKSHLRERLGYWLFKAMGVETSRSVHARLVINGEFSGLYALTEQIDGAFTDYHFDDKDGNLYKEVWPLYMDGKPMNSQSLISALKTNEDDNPSTDIISGFADKLSSAEISDIPNIISEYMDINKIISLAVVDRTIRHDDGFLHWYCDEGGCYSHNFYWYEEPNKKKVNLIPWDLDNAFENIIKNANPVTPIADKWGKTSNNCKPFPYESFGLFQWSAACDKLTGGWATHKELYSELKEKFIKGPFAASNVNALLATWSEQIRPVVKEAQDKNTWDQLSVQQWESNLYELVDQLDFARNKK